MLMHFLEGESVRFCASWMLKILFHLVHVTLLFVSDGLLSVASVAFFFLINMFQ